MEATPRPSHLQTTLATRLRNSSSEPRRTTATPGSSHVDRAPGSWVTFPHPGLGDGRRREALIRKVGDRAAGPSPRPFTWMAVSPAGVTLDSTIVAKPEEEVWGTAFAVGID